MAKSLLALAFAAAALALTGGCAGGCDKQAPPPVGSPAHAALAEQAANLQDELTTASSAFLFGASEKEFDDLTWVFTKGLARLTLLGNVDDLERLKKKLVSTYKWGAGVPMLDEVIKVGKEIHSISKKLTPHNVTDEARARLVEMGTQIQQLTMQLCESVDVDSDSDHQVGLMDALNSAMSKLMATGNVEPMNAIKRQVEHGGGSEASKAAKKADEMVRLGTAIYKESQALKQPQAQ